MRWKCHKPLQQNPILVQHFVQSVIPLRTGADPSLWTLSRADANRLGSNRTTLRPGSKKSHKPLEWFTLCMVRGSTGSWSAPPPIDMTLPLHWHAHHPTATPPKWGKHPTHHFLPHWQATPPLMSHCVLVELKRAKNAHTSLSNCATVIRSVPGHKNSKETHESINEISNKHSGYQFRSIPNMPDASLVLCASCFVRKS